MESRMWPGQDAISLVSSAPVPEDTLGLMQKMTDKLLGH